ncbi:MAG: hypothetical protein ACXQT3_02950 [Methermicoccaceae archaeon]
MRDRDWARLDRALRDLREVCEEAYDDANMEQLIDHVRKGFGGLREEVKEIRSEETSQAVLAIEILKRLDRLEERVANLEKQSDEALSP